LAGRCRRSTGFGSESAFFRYDTIGPNVYLTCSNKLSLPHVQMSAQHGSWIPVHSLPTCLRRSWSPKPAISRPGFPWCQTGYIRRMCICLRRSIKLDTTHSCTVHTTETSLSLLTFKRHVETFLFFLHATSSGLFYKNALHKFTVIIITT